MTYERDREVLTHTSVHLSARFEGVFAPETIERLLHESSDTIAATSQVATYLPPLAERFANDRLRSLARTHGAVMPDPPEILVVCTHTAGRSVAARVPTDYTRAGPNPPRPAQY